MSGIPEHNFPAFHAAAKDLRAQGLEVFNPAEMKDDENQEAHTWEYWMRRDIALISTVDAIAVLPCWEQSKGARLKVSIARGLNMPVYYAATMRPVIEDSEPSWEQLIADIVRWQKKTFPISDHMAKILHLHKEICELMQNPTDGSEFADCFFLLVGAAFAVPLDLKREVLDKFEVNKARTWGEPDANGVVEHIELLSNNQQP